MISQEEGLKLLQLARNSISSCLEDKDVPIDSYHRAHFSAKRGCFVSLHKDAELRGCIGFPEPIMPLHQAVVQAAQAAAFEDPRFPPIDKDELERITIEISVLSELQPINAKNEADYLRAIEIGKDGLVIKLGHSSGLLLPQVAIEYHWSGQEFLEHLCLKAGLPQNSWRDKGSKIYKFQATIVSE